MAMDLGRIGRWHVGLVGATGTLAYATHVGEPGSVLLGGALMGANFWLLRVITGALCRGASDPEKRGRALVALVSVLVKFALFLTLLAGLFVRAPIDAKSFACGVTLLLVACVIEAVAADGVGRKGVVGRGTS
jgi:hypothetical protein